MFLESTAVSGTVQGSHIPRNAAQLPILHQATFCSDMGGQRTLLNIIWSCLFTTLLCTWVSLHPNIPGPDEKWLKVVLRRAGLTVLALIGPELVVAWAMRQRTIARQLANAHQRHGWTETHGFFAIMGGFMAFDGDQPVKILEYGELNGYSMSGEGNFPEITKEEINDKSKGNILAKGLTVFQTGWFMIQCIVRRAQHLAITEAEIMTLAFAALNFVIYGLWWHKPLNVDRSVRVYARTFDPMYRSRNVECPVTPETSYRPHTVEGSVTHESVSMHAIGSSSTNTPEYMSRAVEGSVTDGWETGHLEQVRSGPPPSWYRPRHGTIDLHGSPVLWHRPRTRTEEGSVHVQETHLPRLSTNDGDLTGNEEGGVIAKLRKSVRIHEWKYFDPLAKMIKAPFTYLLFLEEKIMRIRREDGWEFVFRPFFKLGTGDDKVLYDEKRVATFYPGKEQLDRADVFIVTAVATAFGAIHCFAWSYSFPSDKERRLWRICSVAITGIPSVFWLINLCRKYLWFLVFDTLTFMMTITALPPDAYQAVRWACIPHVEL